MAKELTTMQAILGKLTESAAALGEVQGHLMQKWGIGDTSDPRAPDFVRYTLKRVGVASKNVGDVALLLQNLGAGKPPAFDPAADKTSTAPGPEAMRQAKHLNELVTKLTAMIPELSSAAYHLGALDAIGTRREDDAAGLDREPEKLTEAQAAAAAGDSGVFIPDGRQCDQCGRVDFHAPHCPAIIQKGE